MTAPPSRAITFTVRVNPRAKRNAVVKTGDGSLKVYVTAPPEGGRANEAVVDAIAEWLGVKRRQVAIVSGSTSRNKVVSVTGFDRGVVAPSTWREQMRAAPPVSVKR